MRVMTLYCCLHFVGVCLSGRRSVLLTMQFAKLRRRGKRYWVNGKKVLGSWEKGTGETDAAACPYESGRAALHLVAGGHTCPDGR